VAGALVALAAVGAALLGRRCTRMQLAGAGA
jgi:hypothetical protein